MKHQVSKFVNKNSKLQGHFSTCKHLLYLQIIDRSLQNFMLEIVFKGSSILYQKSIYGNPRFIGCHASSRCWEKRNYFG